MEQHSIAPSPTRQQVNCSYSEMNEFNQRIAVMLKVIKPQVMRVNALTLGNAILAGILVGIGTYGSRYRHRAFVRALFQGATTLFLPILSYVVSSASAIVSTLPQSIADPPYGVPSSETAVDMACLASTHLFLDLIWAGLVNIVGIITCTMVAATDREGRNNGLPMALLVQAIWSCYLAVVSLTPQVQVTYNLYNLLREIFALFFVKLALRYYAFLLARRSVGLGHNPPLIVGYMEQLRKGTSRHCAPPQTVEDCPPLVVTGEQRHGVKKVPHGFFFKRLHHDQDDMTMMSSCSGLVTVDRIWLSDDKILTSAPWLKDVCLSFSLFKLLRCRFAGYTVAEAGFQEAYSFFLHVLLKDHERVHGVITDELTFLHDYYYSSIPIHYSNFWLPILNIFVSLLTITYCLYLARLVIPEFITDMKFSASSRAQVFCWITCVLSPDGNYYQDYGEHVVRFGNVAFDVVPVVILIVLVVFAEAREITTYICSNWTKVGLIGRYAQKWQGSPSMQERLGRVLRCRCQRLMKHWDDKMNQCSVLELRPRRSYPILSLISRLHLPADRKRSVKVPMAVKAAIVHALRSRSSSNNNRFLADPATMFLQQSLQDRSGKGIADIILIWHIATGILGVRWQHQQPPPDGVGDMTVATHLSRYCAYLVAYVPELLPDYDKWSKGLYMAVKKDSMRALAGSSRAAAAALPAAESEYEKLVSLLQERAEHEVLRNGVKLARELEREGEGAAWRLLAGFWSQMILYVAPSENLNGHADAIARGGELITFVWALLMHAGFARKPPGTGESV